MTTIQMNGRTAVILDSYREVQAQALAGVSTIKPAAFIGFGDAGHLADNTPRPLNSQMRGLFNEIVVKPITSLGLASALLVRSQAKAGGEELPVVSEAILYDEDMRPVAMAVFPPKYTAAGETYEVILQVHF